MATFTYIARDPNGQRITGQLAGNSAQSILAELESRQLMPVKVEELRERRSFRRVASVRQLAIAYRQMADLLHAGVPLLRALRLLGRSKANPRFAAIMTKVADSVEDGERLADAMAAHPQVFPDVQVAMIRAGERGAFLEDVLERLSHFLESQADLRGRVVGALTYPALLITIGIGVITGAVAILVPQFQDFFSTMPDLPLATRVLIAFSTFLREAWGVVIIGLAALIVLVIWLRRQPKFRRQVMLWQLRIPKLGDLTQAVAVARFARTLGTLLENGIPLIQALQISRDAAGNVLLAEAVDQAIEAVRAGESLADPLARSGLLNDEMLEMISVGESANNLSVVLSGMADTIEKRIDRLLAMLLRLLEPILLLLLAAFVGFIFMALLLPMIRLSSQF